MTLARRDGVRDPVGPDLARVVVADRHARSRRRGRARAARPRPSARRTPRTRAPAAAPTSTARSPRARRGRRARAAARRARRRSAPGRCRRGTARSARSPSNSPKTVCVLPTSIASSIDGAAQARLGRRRRWPRSLMRLASASAVSAGSSPSPRSSSTVTSPGRPDLDARDHPGRPGLVPDPDVLHLQLEERVRGLRHVLQVELVAEVGPSWVSTQ